MLLRSAGQTLGWGFQLQSPWVVSVLCLLFVGIGLNFFGLFEVGLSLTRIQPSGEQQASAGSAWSAFLSGFLTAVVAAPCSAPFMGSAIGYTLDQSTTVTLLVFALVGLGMAAPYLLLSWWPNLLARLPKPGAWMETLKHFLAFPMFLTAVWLAWVLGALQGNDAVACLGASVVLVAFLLWQYGCWQRGGSRFSLALAVLALGTSVWILADYVANDKKISIGASDHKVEWQAFDAQRARQQAAAGKTVFVDFTAAWCISCQANKALVLDSEAGRRVLSASHIVLMRADWTRRDAEITKALASYGRNGVPVYLVLAASKPAVVLPELLTVQMLRDALQAPQ
jgi:thiol:disulfide interchange protein